MMSVLVVGGMMLMLGGLRDVHRDQMQLIDAQQTARLALHQMQRDIQQAGIGLLGMLAPLPVIEPRADGGIDVHFNTDNLTARLSQNQNGPTGHFEVEDVSGFEVGMVVVVYDGTGSYDLTTLTSVDPALRQLHHDGGVGKAYQVADGAAIKRVETISYQLLSVNGTFSLQRQEDSNDAQPVATNVRTLTITYYNDANPPQPFTPVTVADQLRVKVIEVSLEIETENARLNTTQVRTVPLSVRITPRSVLLAS